MCKKLSGLNLNTHFNTMNREQALKNLSLPADADIEMIRMRFAARYTLSDTQYDRALTDRMKELHEQHIRELEQAYKVLTDNPIISDMGALLSLGKGYIKEGEYMLGEDESVVAEEALAFFALYPHEVSELLEQRYAQYVEGLEYAMQQVGLEASKEPFRQEIRRAKVCLDVAINYRLTNQLVAATEQEPEEEMGLPTSDLYDKRLNAHTAHRKEEPSKSKLIGIFTVILCLLLIGAWFAKDYRINDDKERVEEPNGKLEPIASLNIEPERANQPPDITEKKNVPHTLAAPPTEPPLTIVKSILKKYTSGYEITVTKGNIQLTGLRQYLLPLKNIDTINEKDQFVSLSGRSLYVDGKPTKTADGVVLSNIPSADKSRLIDAIRTLAPLPAKAPSALAQDLGEANPILKKDSVKVIAQGTDI